MAKKKLTSDQRSRLRAIFVEMRSDFGEMRELLDAAAERARETETAALRRRARLRRLTFGLLGR
jgi:hypothetical protein